MAGGGVTSGGILRLVASGTLLVGLGWQIIANTAADTAARNDPEGALAWRPDHAGALVAAGEDRLRSESIADDDLAEITRLATRALAANPLSAGALRLLGLTADVQDQEARASALMHLTGDRSRRDAGTWLWLFDEAVRNGDFVQAMASADPILRTDPGAFELLFPALVRIAATAPGEAAVLDALARDPPWRRTFFARLPRAAAGPPIAYALLARLVQTPHPPAAGEIKPYLDQLVSQGDFVLALLAWMRLLPPEESRSLPFVYNGDFEKPVTGLPFDWSLGQIRGAATEIVDTKDENLGNALRVVFSDTRVPYRHMTKLLVLPPGAYELTGMVKADGLDTTRGLRWRISCADGDRQLLAESDAVAGTDAWHAFGETFTVPTGGCTGQWLRLELDARAAIEQQVVGTYWADGLAVRRTDFEPAID